MAVTSPATYTITLQVNGVDTALTATIGGADVLAKDISNSVNVTAGDDLCWKVTPSGSPSVQTIVQIACVFDGVSAGKGVLFSTHSTSTLTSYYMSVAAAVSRPTESSVAVYMPTNGTIASMYVRVSAAPGSGITRTYTLRKNGVDTGLTVSLSGTMQSGNLTGTPIALVKGDYLSIGVIVTGGTPASTLTTIGLDWQPAIDGEAIYFGVAGSGVGASSFWNAHGWAFSGSASIGDVYNIVPHAMIAKKLTARLSNAPGAGKSRSFALNINGSDSALATGIAGSNVANDDATHAVPMAPDDLIAISHVPTNTPAASSVGSASWVGVISSMPPVDYTVNNASELNTVLANSDATLSGKTIGLNPANYGNLTMGARNFSSPLRIMGLSPATEYVGNNRQRAATSGTKARFTYVNFTGSTSNLWLDQLELTSAAYGSGWAGGDTGGWNGGTGGALLFVQSAVYFTAGTHNNVKITGCDIHGGYLGNVDTPYPVDDLLLPDFASILPLFDGTGVVTGFTIPFPNTTLADGTYNMVFTNPNPSASPALVFSVKPVATFTVVSGLIASTNLVSGGASAMRPGTGIGDLSKCITWNGQRPFAIVYPYGVQSASGVSFTGDSTIDDNVFRDLLHGYKPTAPSGTTGRTSVQRNTFERIYCDAFSLGMASSAVPRPLDVMDNFCTKVFWRGGHPRDPHGDFIQTFMNKTLTPSNWMVTLLRNVVVDAQVQSFFISDPRNAPSPIGYEVLSTGNISLNTAMGNAMCVERSVDSFIAGNLFLRYNPADTVRNVDASAIRINDANRSNIIAANIAETMLLMNSSVVASVDVSTRPSVLAGLRGASIPYSAMMVGARDGLPLPTTKDQVLAYVAPTPAYATYGPLSGAHNFATGTTDWSNTQLRPYIKPIAKIGQTAGARITSDPFRILGGAPTYIIAVSGPGTPVFEYSTDEGVSWSATTVGPVTVPRRTLVRLAADVGAAGTSIRNVVISLDSVSYSWALISSETGTRAKVQFDGSVRVTAPVGPLGAASPTGSLVIEAMFGSSNPTATKWIFAPLAGNGAFSLIITPTGLLRLDIRDPAGVAIGRVDSNSSVMDGLYHRVAISWDVTQPANTAGGEMFIDGANRTSSTASWAGGDGVTVGYDRTGLQYSFGALAAAGSGQAGMQVGLFGFKRGVRAAFFDPAVRAQLSPDIMTADMSNVFGSAADIVLKGNAAKWNAGLNDGTGATMTAAGGTVTDV